MGSNLIIDDSVDQRKFNPNIEAFKLNSVCEEHQHHQYEVDDQSVVFGVRVERKDPHVFFMINDVTTELLSPDIERTIVCIKAHGR